MNDSIESFLSSRLPIGGLAAYSVHVSNRALGTECLSKSLYPSTTERMLSGVVQGSQTLLPCGEHAAHYCWTFECHRAYVAVRPDGGCLALLVENNPSAQLGRVQETLQDFLDLPEL
jgi:hypothetical protein